MNADTEPKTERPADRPAKQGLIVFSDDWGRHPSSCQHLIRCLLPETSVTWVNTIAMRPPRIDLLTLRRAAEKLGQWVKPAQTTGDDPLPPNLTVRNPRMWPWMSHRWDRSINCRLLTRQLSADADNAIGVTTLPIAVDLVGELPCRRWIYYCVDDFSVWPGLSGAVLREMELELISKVDVVVAASDHLADAIRPYHNSVHVLTHGVDLNFWQCKSDGSSSEFAQHEAPIIAFWGVIDRRMEADWVIALADRMTVGTIVLAGPQQDPDSRLLTHPRIRTTGPLPLRELPALAETAAVLIMPYADLPVTRAMQPLKLKEYLATGRPVVASRLPAVVPWQDCLHMVESKHEFVDEVMELSTASIEIDDLAIDRDLVTHRLATESWETKAAQFRNLLIDGSS